MAGCRVPGAGCLHIGVSERSGYGAAGARVGAQWISCRWADVCPVDDLTCRSICWKDPSMTAT